MGINYIPKISILNLFNHRFLDLGSNFFKTFDFNMIKGIELSEINLANNMFDEIPESIPDNILSAIMFKVD